MLRPAIHNPYFLLGVVHDLLPQYQLHPQLIPREVPSHLFRDEVVDLPYKLDHNFLLTHRLVVGGAGLPPQLPEFLFA